MVLERERERDGTPLGQRVVFSSGTKNSWKSINPSPAARDFFFFSEDASGGKMTPVRGLIFIN